MPPDSVNVELDDQNDRRAIPLTEQPRTAAASKPLLLVTRLSIGSPLARSCRIAEILPVGLWRIIETLLPIDERRQITIVKVGVNVTYEL